MNFLDRLKIEKKELDIKIEALERFILSKNIDSLDKENQNLLNKQLNIMVEYSRILKKRIDINSN